MLHRAVPASICEEIEKIGKIAKSAASPPLSLDGTQNAIFHFPRINKGAKLEEIGEGAGGAGAARGGAWRWPPQKVSC